MTAKHPTPTRKDHQQFCLTEGWTERKRATNSHGTHPANYELALPDGRILLTRISHPVDRSDYGPSLWAHTLRDQLDVTATEFWACVKEGSVPDRGGHKAPPSAIPVAVVKTLIREVHLAESEVRAMTREQALQRLGEFYLDGH